MNEYTDELGDRIAERLMHGESLEKICETDRYPPRSTVGRWITDPDHPFRKKYHAAREVRAEFMIDEMVEISDDSDGDFVEQEERMVFMGATIQRDKLRVETRKWLISKTLPRFNDKHTVGGDDPSLPININIVNPE